MFNIRQKITVESFESSGFLVRSDYGGVTFGRGVSTQFTAIDKDELKEKLNSIIQSVPKDPVVSITGYFLVYPRSSSCFKGIKALPVTKEALEDFKRLASIL